MQKTGEGHWPFGKETPLADFSQAFKTAGIQFLGQTFMGKTWAESFISSLSGLDRELCQGLMDVHRSPLIPKSQQSYLLAGLGSVSAKKPKIPSGWKRSSFADDTSNSELSAALADALALKINAEHRLCELQAQISNPEGERPGEALQAKLKAKDEIIRERDKGIDWLRGELSESRKQMESMSASFIANLAAQKSESEKAVYILQAKLRASERRVHDLSQAAASAVQRGEHDEMIQDLQAKLHAGEQTIEWLEYEVTKKDRVIQSRDESLAWLRGELTNS